MILSLERIRLAAEPADKEAAIRQAARLLIDSGAIDAAYAHSMLRREGEADTFLGNGIAIPHGQRADRGLIARTAIAVLQVPQGVNWNSEDVARLVVAIAAQGDEHIAVLRRLTDVLGETELAEKLARTMEPRDILAALDPDAPLPAATRTNPVAAGDGLTALVEAPAAAGMHARPAKVLAQLAKTYQSKATLRLGERSADAKSMIAVLQLGAGPKAAMALTVSGPDAPVALEALKAAFADQLGGMPMMVAPPQPLPMAR